MESQLKVLLTKASAVHAPEAEHDAAAAAEDSTPGSPSADARAKGTGAGGMQVDMEPPQPTPAPTSSTPTPPSPPQVGQVSGYVATDEAQSSMPTPPAPQAPVQQAGQASGDYDYEVDAHVNAHAERRRAGKRKQPLQTTLPTMPTSTHAASALADDDDAIGASSPSSPSEDPQKVKLRTNFLSNIEEAERGVFKRTPRVLYSLEAILPMLEPHPTLVHAQARLDALLEQLEEEEVEGEIT